MQHDGGTHSYAPASIVARWPRGGFVENIAVAPDGAIFVTLHTDKAVVRVDPASGAVTPFAQFVAPVAGLAFAADGGLVVSGGTRGQRPGVIWRVSPDGAVSRLADLPDAAFLNGVTPLGAHFLVADSLGGLVYAVHGGTMTVPSDQREPAKLVGAEGAAV